MKRAQSQTNHATASGTATGNGTPTATDIMSSPLVLQHELRHVKVRLRERSLAFEELSQLHHEHMKAMKQQTLYVKKLEEAWANMELALQALVPDKNLPSSSAHASSTTSSFPSDNPILAMFSNRWCELSGRSREEMQSEMKAFSKKLDNRMADVDEEDDEEDEEEDETRKEKDLSNELKYSLDQRVEFSRSLLESVLTHLRSPPSSEPDSAARIALLEAANLQLQQRIHSNTNELILLNTALSSRDQRIESLEDKNAMLTRKLERLKEDVESGKVAAAAAAAQRAENEAAASANQASTVKVEMGENGSIKLEDSAAVKYSALSAKAATIPDSRPFKSEELGELSTIFPSIANSPTPIVVTTLDVLQLREELADYKSLADRRQDQLKQLKEQKTQLERDLDLARMRILQDDQAIRGTKLFQSLSKSFEQTNHNLHRLQYEFETAQTRLQEEHRNRQQLELDHNNCLQRGEALYEQSLAKATNEIESLKSTILQLQHEREEWLSAHITDVELNSFFQKMRTDIIPSLDKQLREFTTFMTQYKADKENVQQLQSNGAGNETVHFARVMRVWKQQEIALKAELEVFRNAVKESSDPTSSSSSTFSSPSSTRTAALEAENAALKSELDSFLSSDSNTLHLQLSQAKELSQVLGEELNSVSASHEEVQLSAAKLTTTIAEYTRSLDKFRHEKVQTTKLLNSLRQESLALKSKLDLCDQSSSLHSKVVRDAKFVASEAQKESARLRDELHQLTVSLDQERAIQSHQQQLSAEYKTKFMQLCNQHETCEKTIEELRERESEHSSSYHRIAEQFILLKGRFASLRSSAGLSKKSKSSESSSSSGDADVIKSLKLLINCRVCESKQKSKVIVKCMHAFCADCIQSNLDTRLRKCPQCGLKFGESDVKSLYL